MNLFHIAVAQRPSLAFFAFARFARQNDEPQKCSWYALLTSASQPLGHSGVHWNGSADLMGCFL
jgi:hypothetical protein